MFNSLRKNRYNATRILSKRIQLVYVFLCHLFIQLHEGNLQYYFNFIKLYLRSLESKKLTRNIDKKLLYIYNKKQSTRMEVQDSKLVYVTYVCGSSKCGRELKLKTNDAVKCTECAYRILYKKRVIDPKDPIQYQAI